MSLLRRSLPLSLLRLALVTFTSTVFAHADQWTAPTPEELHMTSQPEVPGASAVYLFREETTEDNLHMFSVYVRLKVLTEGGKKFGDIELPYAAGGALDRSIDSIAGRTIHPDGTVIPFTGTPYDKLIEKTHDHKYMAKVFSMPDVQVGSIIEYRYKIRHADNYYIPPQWYVQSEVFTRRSHYLWKPTDKQLLNERGQLTGGVSWTMILPQGTKLVEKRTPQPNSGSAEQLSLELSLHDVPPAPDEEYMPPITSFTYRVNFYYSPYQTGEEFWKNEGKFWAKNQDKFIGPGPAVTAAVKQLTTSTDTDEQKLHKLYNAVQELENTRFTRNHSQSEDKAQGFRELKNTDDIWLRKRGTDDQLAQLFVAMARTAGFKAYAMSVSDRSHRLFIAPFLSLDQLDDTIAIVTVNGKEVYLDPGTKFCPYGQLMWTHTMAGGLRQVDGGATIARSPEESYANSRVLRVANLTMDRDGIAVGTVKMTFMGAPAVRWRQRSLEGDDESLRRELRTNLEHLLPHSMEVKVASIQNLGEFDQPLVVLFDVKGNPGSSTGKRLIVPGDIFEANATPTFPHEKRDIGVYFEYGRILQDAVRINFPPDFSVESLPTAGKLEFNKLALYNFTSEGSPTSFTIRRNYTLGSIIYSRTEYPELRAFYASMEAKDGQNVVLKVPAPTVEKASATPN